MRALFLSSLGAAALSSLLSLAPTTASAISCGGFTLEASSACEGPIAGNTPYPGALTAFGMDYMAIDKDEDQNIVAGFDPDTGNPESWFHWTGSPVGDATSGEWFVDPAVWSLYGSLVIALKAGPEYAVFLLTPTDSSGTWTSRIGLSHADLYGKEDDMTMPEPGSLALLGLGLLGLGAARRRRTG